MHACDLQPPTSYLLHTTYYPFPTTYDLLPSFYLLLPTTYYLLSPTGVHSLPRRAFPLRLAPARRTPIGRNALYFGLAARL